VLTHEILSAAIKKARKVPPYIARQAADEYMPHLGPVTLPAQDRAEELCRAYHERAADMDGHMVGRWQYHGPESQAICTEAMRHAIASLGAPPTSPPAARPVFAGVSEDDLCVQMLMAADPSIDPGVALTMVNGVHRAKVRAVLTRLKTTLVAPVAGEPDAAAKVRALRAKLAEAKRLGRDACELAKAYADDARGTVGGLLAAGEERESRAWSEKGKAPPGSCPFCASRISMVQRDGYFIARCSHRGCGAVGPRMRSVSRAADLFCQPPRREAQGMSCGPIVASPPRPRCSCTHEAGDSRCNVHPTCSECGASTTRPVDGCEACRGPLPKGAP
jgi:hypothetical protein